MKELLLGRVWVLAAWISIARSLSYETRREPSASQLMWRSFKSSASPIPPGDEQNNNKQLDDVLEDVEDLSVEDTGRNSRSASVGSVNNQPSSSASASAQSNSITLPRPTPPDQQPSPNRLAAPGPCLHKQHFKEMALAFDMNAAALREAPAPPSTEGIEYPRAASWASGTLTNTLNDEKGRQLFRCFLFDALAEENLNFLEAVDKLKKMKQNDEKQKFAREVVDNYSPYVNLSSGSMQKIKAAAESENPDPNEFAPACKEIRRLLENDQYPRFRRSDCYLNYLEELLPKAYAEKWATSFEALLGNHVGRQHFRLFLRSIHAEENLRFWEAVVEFRATKNKSPAMLNLARVILQAYLAEGQNNEVFLPFGVRQVIERKIADKEVDISLFDEAIKHVEQVLRNDPYVRFLQSQEYLGLLSKLKQ